MLADEGATRGAEMSKSDHPSYPNPIVAEAVCEIRYQPVSGRAWKPSLPGELFKRIQNTYPEMEPGTEMGVEFQFGPGGMVQRLAPPRHRARFKHVSEPVLLQLAENLLVVNVLPRYPGWASMRRVVLEAWGLAKPILEPAEIVRIGLRFINRIEREFPEQKPGAWFRATEYLASAVLESLPGFLSRVESRLDGRIWLSSH